jgi:CubicO group peptidase (beta-lactamase class C family)
LVPDFPNGNRITIEELLTHYSGLGDASSQPDYNDWSRFPQTPDSLVAKLAKLPLRFEPGTKYFYSNSNYHLLALIIEKASGQSFGDFLEQNIFKPLAMTSTAHHSNDKPSSTDWRPAICRKTSTRGKSRRTSTGPRR